MATAPPATPPRRILDPTGENLSIVSPELAAYYTDLRSQVTTARSWHVAGRGTQTFVFNRFVDFPAEIRDRIYRFACLHPRIVEIFSDEHVHSPTPMPALMHASSESRKAAKTLYRELAFGEQVLPTVVNWDVDTIFLNEHYGSYLEWEPLRDATFLKSCKHLALTSAFFLRDRNSRFRRQPLLINQVNQNQANQTQGNQTHTNPNQAIQNQATQNQVNQIQAQIQAQAQAQAIATQVIPPFRTAHLPAGMNENLSSLIVVINVERGESSIRFTPVRDPERVECKQERVRTMLQELWEYSCIQSFNVRDATRDGGGVSADQKSKEVQREKRRYERDVVVPMRRDEDMAIRLQWELEHGRAE